MFNFNVTIKDSTTRIGHSNTYFDEAPSKDIRNCDVVCAFRKLTGA